MKPRIKERITLTVVSLGLLAGSAAFAVEERLLTIYSMGEEGEPRFQCEIWTNHLSFTQHLPPFGTHRDIPMTLIGDDLKAMILEVAKEPVIVANLTNSSIKGLAYITNIGGAPSNNGRSHFLLLKTYTIDASHTTRFVDMFYKTSANAKKLIQFLDYHCQGHFGQEFPAFIPEREGQ